MNRSSPRTRGRDMASRTDLKKAVDCTIPQEKLWLFVQSAWPGQAEANYRLPIAGRRFEADIAFPRKSLAIEVDGWNFHGKRYGDFQRDREKGNALPAEMRGFPQGSSENCVSRTLAALGWTLLRFPAMDVQYRFQHVVNTIQATMTRLNRDLPYCR